MRLALLLLSMILKFKPLVRLLPLTKSVSVFILPKLISIRLFQTLLWLRLMLYIALRLLVRMLIMPSRLLKVTRVFLMLLWFLTLQPCLLLQVVMVLPMLLVVIGIGISIQLVLRALSLPRSLPGFIPIPVGLILRLGKFGIADIVEVA